jgi:hypothetical protein
MQNLSQIAVYFNNGASVRQPWHVASMEGKALATDHGHFTNAETAIMHACELVRISRAALVVPTWLQTLADEIAADDARYAECRENDNIGCEECQGGW